MFFCKCWYVIFWDFTVNYGSTWCRWIKLIFMDSYYCPIRYADSAKEQQNRIVSIDEHMLDLKTTLYAYLLTMEKSITEIQKPLSHQQDPIPRVTNNNEKWRKTTATAATTKKCSNDKTKSTVKIFMRCY